MPKAAKAPKPPAPTTGPDDLSDLYAEVAKDLKGAATICHLDEVQTPYHHRTPTGITSVDMGLRGGFPGGSLHQLASPERHPPRKRHRGEPYAFCPGAGRGS